MPRFWPSGPSPNGALEGARKKGLVFLAGDGYNNLNLPPGWGGKHTLILTLILEEALMTPFYIHTLALSSGTNSLGTFGSTLVMILLMVAVFYFFIIRPEGKKKKAAQSMRDSLKVGDEITTIGGIVGTVCAVKEATVVVETGADRVRIEFTRWAISSKGTQREQNAAPEQEQERKEGVKKGKDGEKDGK